MIRKSILGIGAAMAMAAMSYSVAAAEFPCRTAKLIVPWNPGGGTDVIFRIFANNINDSGAKPHHGALTR